MHFNPAKVSLMAIANLFKMLSAHCAFNNKNETSNEVNARYEKALETKAINLIINSSKMGSDKFIVRQGFTFYNRIHIRLLSFVFRKQGTLKGQKFHLGHMRQDQTSVINIRHT